MPNPSIVAGNTNSGSFTTSTQATVSSTGSVTAGNLMVCVLTVGGATAPSALLPPDGTWTTFRTTIANAVGGTIVTAVFYKQATATGSFSGLFTWTTTATSGSWGFFVVNQPGAALVDGNFLSTQNASATNTSPSSNPSAGLVNDTLICGLIGAVVGVDTLTQPAGMTSIINIAGTSTQPFFSIASQALASSAVTGTKTWTVPTSQTNLGFTFFIQQGPVFDFTAYDATLPQPSYHNRTARAGGAVAAGEPGIEGKLNLWRNFGWSIILHQPQYPRPARTGAIALGDTGTEAKFIPTVATPSVFEAQLPSLPNANPSIARRGAGASGKSSFAASNLTPWSDVLAWQPLYFRSAHRGAMVPGESGMPIAPVVAPAVGWWDIQSPVFRIAPTISQRAAAASGRSSFAAFNLKPFTEIQSLQPPSYPRTRQRYPGTKGSAQFRIFPDLVNMGWEVMPPQPPRSPRTPQRGTAASGKSSFAAFNLTAWAEIQNWQPMYPRAVHRGTMMPGDPGNQATFIPPVTGPVLWGLDPTPFAKRNLYRAGTFTERDVETPLIGFFPFGWPVQPIQPGHPNPEKRSAAIARGDDGAQAQQINFYPAGWQVQPHQPQHPRPERAGAIMVGEPGNEGVFSFIAPVFVPDGYNPTAFMPRIRFARAGSIARGEDGTEGLYSVWLPSGWQIADPTQRTRRRLRPDETPFSPHALGARFQWGQIDPAMTLPTRRRTLTRAEFHIEGKFVFVPPLPLNIVFNPDNLLRRTLFHPGAAIMPFDGGWFQQRYVSVFFASSIITQASGDTAVTAATGQTVLSNQA